MGRAVLAWVAAMTTMLAGGSLAGCSSSGSTPDPGGGQDSGAANELARLAGLGAAATYTATYLFHQSTPDSTATVSVWHAPPQLRVDVKSGTTTATFLRAKKATYSCAITKRKVCFVVANPGAKVPAPFDVGPASLFSDDLATLSVSGSSYVVTRAQAMTASGDVPAATCYAVKPGVLTPQPAVQPGTYCFTASGVLTAVIYPSGNTARITVLRTRADPARFKPYAVPSALPR